MPRTVTTATSADSHEKHHETETETDAGTGPRVEWVDEVHATGATETGLHGGLATYYRLRCIALESTVTALQAEIDRQERRTQRIRDRYEELLQGRDCEDDPVFTR